MPKPQTGTQRTSLMSLMLRLPRWFSCSTSSTTCVQYDRYDTYCSIYPVALGCTLPYVVQCKIAYSLTGCTCGGQQPHKLEAQSTPHQICCHALGQ